LLTVGSFKFIDWFTFKPLVFLFKQIRNDVWLKLYVHRQPRALQEFLEKTEYFKNANLMVVVAFEQPWALNWLLSMAKKNIPDTTILVFDNSRNLNSRAEIEAVCEANSTLYFSLPVNNTKHVNRSHGMAMSWIFENVIKKIEPATFAFIDHDLIPVSPVDFAGMLETQPFFGRLGGRDPSKYWSLWAGFCIFKYDFLKDKKINFLYDFSLGLDTGGRNWGSLYSHFDKDSLKFASRTYQTFYLPEFEDGASVELIDNKWVHIGGVTYKQSMKPKLVFFEAFAKRLEKFKAWEDFCQWSCKS